ncbi:MAG: tetraacyldisaccharide 4'-kinase [Bacteroidales bacterium]|nr:tetraacyldisaccharide 4'-kinase [Bacteroidales bacterium]
MTLDRILLFPYYLTLKWRHRLFDKGVRKVHKAEVPTVCVGNVTVGGTGKTPHVEMILRSLLAGDRWGAANIAVLSRGYKRESKGFQQVTRDGSATMFGDEPVQIKKKFPVVTVAVDADRVEGCDFLCHPDKLQKDSRRTRRCWDKDFPPAHFIVLDDAFQYRALKADLDIVLIDFSRPVFKDRLLPLGRLRDLPERVSKADVVIVTKCPQELDNWERTTWAEQLGLSDFRSSDCSGARPDGSRQTLLFTRIAYGQMEPVFDCSDQRYIYSKRIILFSGIARDTQLRAYLGGSYKIVKRFSFPDHHKFGWSDFQRIQHAVKRWPTAAVVTTEKDAVRVLDCNGLPAQLKERMFQLPIRAEFLSENERAVFEARLSNPSKR